MAQARWRSHILPYSKRTPRLLFWLLIIESAQTHMDTQNTISKYATNVIYAPESIDLSKPLRTKMDNDSYSDECAGLSSNLEKKKLQAV